MVYLRYQDNGVSLSISIAAMTRIGCARDVREMLTGLVGSVAIGSLCQLHVAASRSGYFE
jgi:hypothetical protein